jgi:hypothetical protein
MSADKQNKNRPFSDRVQLLMAAIVLPLLLPLLVIVVGLWLLSGLLLQLLIWLTWLPLGRDTLVIYSNSPHWKEFFELNLLPAISDRAVVLNWSDLKKWRSFSLSSLSFRYFAGSREFNPMLVIFRPFRWAQRFRLWMAFQDYKHGNSERLAAAMNRLAEELNVPQGRLLPTDASA